jgi:hypothetical protein
MMALSFRPAMTAVLKLRAEVHVLFGNNAILGEGFCGPKSAGSCPKNKPVLYSFPICSGFFE